MLALVSLGVTQAAMLVCPASVLCRLLIAAVPCNPGILLDQQQGFVLLAYLKHYEEANRDRACRVEAAGSEAAGSDLYTAHWSSYAPVLRLDAI